MRSTIAGIPPRLDIGCRWFSSNEHMVRPFIVSTMLKETTISEPSSLR